MSKNNERFTKITESMVYGEDDNRLPLCDWIRTQQLGHCVDMEMTTCDALIDCESPIEQALSMEMMVAGLRDFSTFTAKKIDVVAIEKQVEISVAGHKYRADFLIPVVYRTRSGSRYVSYVIECDGHDFHEKTKEQIAKNNQRERDIRAAGYEVIRFSGSEIYKSPSKCVEEIVRIIISRSAE